MASWDFIHLHHSNCCYTYIVFRQRETGGYVKQSGSSKGKATTSYNVDNIPLTVVWPPATSTSYAYQFRMWLSNQIVITLRFRIGPMNVRLQCTFVDSNYSHTYVALIAKLSMRLLHGLLETIWLAVKEPKNCKLQMINFPKAAGSQSSSIVVVSQFQNNPGHGIDHNCPIEFSSQAIREELLCAIEYRFNVLLCTALESIPGTHCKPGTYRWEGRGRVGRRNKKRRQRRNIKSKLLGHPFHEFV